MISSIANFQTWICTIVLFITCLILGYFYFKHKFSYWRERGIIHFPGTIPFGSLKKFILSQNSISETISEIYYKGKGHKYIGYYSFTSPAVVIRDLDLIKNIMVKDFDNFTDRGMYFNEKDDPLSAHLFALGGSKWKNMRTKLTHSFTSSKLKIMYEIMKYCSDQLKNYMIELTDKKDDVIDFKYLISKHSINIIANTAVGMETHGIKDDSELSKAAFKATDSSLIQACRFILPMISKDISHLLRLRFTPKEVEKYYLKLTKSIIEYRLNNNVRRNDFFQQLLEMYEGNDSTENSEGDKLSLNDLAAQTFLFFLAGYESAASTICFCLYELAMNTDIQDKLINEIDSVNGDITYDELNDLKYMDMVLKEVWRKYPPGGFLFRECSDNYKLDDGVILEKGMTVTIPVLGIQRDPEYFPDPERFDPERFNKSSPSQEIKPFSYLPFGEGPRYCIGKRIELSEKTMVPPTLDPKVFVLHAHKGMHLRAINRKKQHTKEVIDTRNGIK